MSFLGGLVDSFTGQSAKKDLDAGIAAVNQGKTDAIGAYKTAGDQAQGYLKPYIDQGGSAFKMYGDTLGVNGTGARDAAQSTYLSDPILQKQLALQQKERGWSSNSRGGYGSGADALAASRVNLQGYGDWQNRLAGAGQQGQAAAGQGAGLAEQTGAGIAGAYTGAAGQTAQLLGQKASAENTLAQNLIGLGGVATNYFGGNNLNKLGAKPQPYPQQPGYPYSGVQMS